MQADRAKRVISDEHEKYGAPDVQPFSVPDNQLCRIAPHDGRGGVGRASCRGGRRYDRQGVPGHAQSHRVEVDRRVESGRRRLLAGDRQGIAQRNLVWSIVAENIGFSIWLIWSVVATKLPKIGFQYTPEQLFDLVAVPGLVGALMRFPYAFAVPRFGGRNWTIVSAALLFIPTTLLAVLVTRPDTPYGLMVAAAATAGLGGGNFASSMSNISFFFPDREKGFALGLNAAGGNIGVSTVQLLVPIVIGWGWLSLGAGRAGRRPLPRQRGPHVDAVRGGRRVRRLPLHG